MAEMADGLVGGVTAEGRRKTQKGDGDATGKRAGYGVGFCRAWEIVWREWKVTGIPLMVRL